MENGEFMADNQKINEQNHEVFISYSSKNAEYANAVHEKLENAGIKCWIDYNNIRTSQNFAQEIVDYCVDAGYAADANDVSTAAGAWGRHRTQKTGCPVR